MSNKILLILLAACCFGFTPSITSFNNGAVSPLMESRSDFQKYQSSCRLLENMIALTQGPVTRRPGTQYIAMAGDANGIILLPFEYSTEDAYILELGKEYMRFYRSGAQIIDPCTSTPYQITTPFKQSDLSNIQVVHNDNTAYLVDGEHPPQKLTRTSHTNWTIKDADITTGPFQDAIPNNTITLTPTGDVNVVDANITIIASSGTFFAPDANYVPSLTANGYFSGLSGISKTVTVLKNQTLKVTISNWGVDLNYLLQTSYDNVTWSTVTTYTGSVWNYTTSIETHNIAYYRVSFTSTITRRRGATASYSLVTSPYSNGTINQLYVDSIWQINQRRAETAVLKGKMTSDANSVSSIYFTGGYSFTTTATSTFDGTVILQRSTNNGNTWTNALAPVNSSSISNPSEIEKSGAIYRVHSEGITGGSVRYVFTVQDLFNHGVVRITSIADGSRAYAKVLAPLLNTTATSNWREGYWSNYRGWPRTVSFHQQRLVFGGSTSFPQMLWFGAQNSNNFLDFTEGTLATDAFNMSLAGQNPIQWLLSQDYLFIGTTGSVGRYGEQGAAITPTSPSYREQSKAGSSNIPAQLAGDAMLYIERGNRKVREFAYNLSMDKYTAPDLTVLSENITESGVRSAVFQQRPSPTYWCILNNGDIATLTYFREQEVVAWSRQKTDGLFESAAVIHGASEDEVWFSVARTIGGATTRYIEQFKPIDWGTDPNDCWFVDSGLSYSGSATSVFGGLNHLIGKTVAVYADGVILPSVVVNSLGEVTIARLAGKVTIGLPYTSKMETMPMVLDQPGQSTTSMNKRINAINFDFYNTGYVQYGNGKHSTLTTANLSNNAIADVNAIVKPLYTSEVTPLHCAWVYGGRKKQTVYLESSAPMPLTVRSIVPELEITP